MLEVRNRELGTAAAHLGLTLTNTDPVGLLSRYLFVDSIREGLEGPLTRTAKLTNVVHGHYQGNWVLAFDYFYYTEVKSSGAGTSRRHRNHQISFFILEQEKVYPEIRIYPKKFFDKILHFAKRGEIDFGGDTRSETFTRAYTVYAEDEAFARKLCRPDMMDRLLAEPGSILEVEGTAIVLEDEGSIQAGALRDRLDRLLRFATLISKYS